MLKQLSVESYRTLRNTTVEFHDGLNIIIGKNGVGKSNLLNFIAEYTNVSLRFSSSRKVSAVRGKYSYQLAIDDAEQRKTVVEVSQNRDVEHDLGAFSKIAIAQFKDGVEVARYPDILMSDMQSRLSVERALYEGRPFQGTYIQFQIPYIIPYITAPVRIHTDEDGFLEFQSENILGFLSKFESEFDDRLSEHHGDFDLDFTQFRLDIGALFAEIVDGYELNRLLERYSNIQEIRLGHNANIYLSERGFIIENLVLEFKVDDRWMPWSYLSDGTKRSFYLIAQVAYAKNELILIEEPELGLHPTQLFNLMTFIKEQSESKQIILSTHSPIVLNILNEDELDHILVARLEKGVSSFRQMSDAAKEKARRYMTEVGDLSDFWLHSNMEDND